MESEETQARWQRQLLQARGLSCQKYFHYVQTLWEATGSYGYYAAARAFLRRARVVRIVWRAVRIFWLLLEAGTLLLLLLPLLLAIALGGVLMLLGGTVELWRVRRQMSAQMKDKTVLFWCAELSALDTASPSPKGKGIPPRLVEEWTERRDALTVIVRSPHLFSSRGIGGHGFYFAHRREAANVYLARTYAVFALKKTASRVANRVIWVI